MRLTIFDTPVISHLMVFIAWLSLKLAGWKTEGEKPAMSRYVLIGAPHTSNWDFLLFMAIALRFRIKLYWLGKASLFRGPMGPVMRWLGGIPVHRDRNCNLVCQTVAAFRRYPRLVLALSPEGTRSYVSEWKTGFYHIARQAGVPILPGYLDARTKTVGLGQPIRPSGDIAKDMACIRQFYSAFSGIRPERSNQPSMPLQAENDPA